MDITELWHKFNGQLLGYILKNTNSKENAEDILSEVFLSAMKYQSTLVTMSLQQCRSWLYTTARNKIIDAARKKKPDISLTPLDEKFDDDFSQMIVSEAVSKLPDDLQDLVGLRYFADLDSGTIGNILGIPAATVRTRLRKARMLLRKYWSMD